MEKVSIDYIPLRDLYFLIAGFFIAHNVTGNLILCRNLVVTAISLYSRGRGGKALNRRRKLFHISNKKIGICLCNLSDLFLE